MSLPARPARDAAAPRGAGDLLAEWARTVSAAADGGPRAGRAWLAAARCLDHDGDPAAAEDLALHGLDQPGTDPATRIDLLRVLAGAQVASGRHDDAVDALDAASRLAAGHGDARLRGEVLADLALLAASLTAPRRDLAADLAATLATLGTPDDTLGARLQASLAAALAFREPDRARHLARSAAGLVDGGAVRRSPTTTDPGAAARAAAAVCDVAALLGAAVGEPPAQSLVARAVTALRTGDRDTLGALVARGPARGRAGAGTGALLAVLPHTRTALAQFRAPAVAPASPDTAAAFVAIHLGVQLATGRPAALAAELVGAAPAPSSLSHLVVQGQAAVAAHLGVPGAAQRVSGLHTPLPDDPAQEAALCLRALAAARLGDREACAATVAALGETEHTLAAVLLGVLGPVGWFTAWAHHALGDETAALQANAAAAQACARAGAVAWSVQCTLQLARLSATRDPAHATRIRRRARDRARALGLAEGPGRGAAGRAPAGGAAGADRLPVAMTGRPVEVLALAARGLTNEEIARRLGVSVSTVERHLTQAYRALGVSNRAQAVAAAGVAEPAGRLDTAVPGGRS